MPVTSVEETTGLVLLVPFPMGDVDWVVRVKRVVKDNRENLSVVQAFTKSGRVITATQWESKLALTGRAEEFWAEVVLQVMMQREGAKVAKA